MRILLTEKQFNLIILSEDRPPTKKGDVYDKFYVDYTADEVRKEIEHGVIVGKYKIRTDVLKNKSLRNKIEDIEKETKINILDEFFPIKEPINKMFDKPYKDYTPDEVRKEIQQGIVKGFYKQKTSVIKKNSGLYKRVLSIIEDMGMDILKEFFGSEYKMFDKYYTQYNPDEVRKEIQQGIEEGFYKTRSGLKTENPQLYKRILKLDKDFEIGLMVELFPDPIESVGEYLIKLYLESKKIKFAQQKKFGGLKSRKGGDLKIDFYLPEFNTIIEFDGMQHFQPIKWSKNITNEEAELYFQIIQNNDNLKNEYCNDRCNLYRIKHNSKNSISPKTLNEKMGIIFKDIESGNSYYEFNKSGIYI